MRADQAKPGDIVWIGPIEDSRVYTVAISRPDDLNEGGWYLEMEEAGPDTEGWPAALHCQPDTQIDRRG